MLKGFDGHHAVEAVVISFLVVLEHPCAAELANLVKVTEQPGIQHFFPIRSIEALDVGVLIRLARLNVRGIMPGCQVRRAVTWRTQMPLMLRTFRGSWPRRRSYF